MNLMQAGQQLVKQVTTNGATGFAVPVIFSVSSGSTVLSRTVNALAIKHHFQIGDTGPVSAKTSRVTVSELALVESGYPVRDTNNEVKLINHKVTWTDVSGVQATYVVRKQYPNDMLGKIVLELGEYKAVTPPGKLIIGWQPGKIVISVRSSPGTEKQVLANGDEILIEYAPNTDETLTIPYLAGKSVLTPFLIDGGILQGVPYLSESGKFNISSFGGGFSDGNNIEINASIPIYAI